MDTQNQEEYQAKERAFYSAMLSAWLSSKAELDKQLLGLSATGIGLVVTLLRTVDIHDELLLSLFCVALACLLVVVISVLFILRGNTKHIEDILNGAETESKVLSCLDKLATFSFAIAIIVLVAAGLRMAALQKQFISVTMTQSNRPSQLSQQVSKASETHSINGVASLRPQPPQKSSESSGTNGANTSSGQQSDSGSAAASSSSESSSSSD